MHVVTGANMGGKSTWMRSCGAAALLAHAGCLVPAASATVPRLKALCARVGAADREQRGQSTFMLEMIESATILRVSVSRMDDVKLGKHNGLVYRKLNKSVVTVSQNIG